MQHGDYYQRLWDDFLELADKIDGMVDDLGKRYSEFDSESVTFKRRISTGKSIFSSLVRDAEQAFAPTGGTLQIDTYEYLDWKKPLEQYEWSNFSPSGLWAALEEAYGGSKGVEIGYRQTAHDLIHTFSLNRDDSVERKSGYVILRIRVWMDSFDRKWSKRNRLNYSCADTVNKSLSTLSAFADWAGDDELAFACKRLRWSTQHDVTSREKTIVSGNLMIVTFLEYFEFRFTQQLAENLQIFLGQYGFANHEAAA
ncbi:MAG: hypothetical protein HZB57_08740 [Gammaproteobacteria bacterium]|nr:hypothetical protein [Gammaproteobacteria bacterium]